MKFAIVDGERREAMISGQRGICPGCGAVVVAKCGRVKTPHWAHLSGKDCDSWHEPETEWHRAWKNQFPAEWQEKDFVNDKTGEHHRADVHTEHGLTIEFQHSAITPNECDARETFYSSVGDMIWVVDGTRGKSIWKKFNSNRDLLFSSKNLPDDTLCTKFPDELFPKNWLARRQPIFFDFLGNQASEGADLEKQVLVCLLPKTNTPGFLVRLIARDDFIIKCHSGGLKQWLSIINNLSSYKELSTPPTLPMENKQKKTLTESYIMHTINGRTYIIYSGTPRKKLHRL